MIEDVGEEDLFATADGIGVESEEGAETGSGRADGLAKPVGAESHLFGGSLEGVEDAEGDTGIGPGSVDGDFSG